MKHLSALRSSCRLRFSACQSQRLLCSATLFLGSLALQPADAADYFWKGGDGVWDLGIHDGAIIPGTGGSLLPSSGAIYDPAGTWISGTSEWRTAGDAPAYWVNAQNVAITATSGPTGPWIPDSELRGRAIFEVEGGGRINVANVTSIRTPGIFGGALTFRTDGYEIYSDAAGGARMEMNFGTGITIDPGVTAKIGSGIDLWLSGGDNITGGGTLDLTGTISRSSAGVIRINNDTTINVGVGGRLGAVSNQIFVGSAGTGTLNVDGGTITVGGNGQNRSLILAAGSSASGTVNLNAGTINITNAGTGRLQLGDAQSGSTTATLNLNGGVLTTTSIVSGSGSGVNSTFNFNGGVLRPAGNSATFMNGLTNAVVGEGGAIIDTNNFNVTIAQAFVHDSTMGVIPDGGLTKNGTGTLALTGLNTYTGDTEINAGTLSIAHAFLSDLGSVFINGPETYLDLAFVETDTITSLYFDGLAAGVGVWGAAGSGAQFESDRITGTGFLNVTAIPEPATAALVLMAFAGALRRRR